VFFFFKNKEFVNDQRHVTEQDRAIEGSNKGSSVDEDGYTVCPSFTSDEEA